MTKRQIDRYHASIAMMHEALPDAMDRASAYAGLTFRTMEAHDFGAGRLLEEIAIELCDDETLNVKSWGRDIREPNDADTE